MNKQLLLGFALAIVFGSVLLWISYQHFVVIPQEQLTQEKEEAKNEQLAALLAEQRKEARLQACYADAYTAYSARWDSKCEVEDLGDDCTLMKYQYESIEAEYAQEKQNCITLYK